MQMILSRQALRYSRLDTLNIKINLQTAEIIFQLHFWPPGRKRHRLQVILLCGGDRYSRLDTLNIKIGSLVQNL